MNPENESSLGLNTQLPWDWTFWRVYMNEAFIIREWILLCFSMGLWRCCSSKWCFTPEESDTQTTAGAKVEQTQIRPKSNSLTSVTVTHIDLGTVSNYSLPEWCHLPCCHLSSTAGDMADTVCWIPKVKNYKSAYSINSFRKDSK